MAANPSDPSDRPAPSPAPAPAAPSSSPAPPPRRAAGASADAPTRPDPAQVIRAIDAYVRLAYGGEPPVTVRSQLATLQSFRGNFFKNPVFVSDGKTPPMRYAARLGNPSYPHMKLAVERAPDGRTWLFRVDTHDGHCLPPMDSPEHEPFARLMADNRALADRIEEAWTAEGLPTFKRYLREDLASRTPA